MIQYLVGLYDNDYNHCLEMLVEGSSLEKGGH